MIALYNSLALVIQQIGYIVCHCLSYPTLFNGDKIQMFQRRPMSDIYVVF